MDKKKKIWIACGAVVLLGLIVFFSINATRRDEVSVQTSMVELKDELMSKVAASGEIRAKEFVDLQTEIAGIIKELLVEEGQKVDEGDVLLRIDPIQTEAETNSTLAQLEAQRSDARAQEFQIFNAEANLARDQASLRSAEADLVQAESTFRRAENSYKRKQLLHEDGLISREDYELAQNNADVAKAQRESAKARRSQIEAQIRVSKNTIQQMKNTYTGSLNRVKSMVANATRARDQLSKTTLYSPLSGVITQLLVDEGERAVPGIMSNPQATLMTIADLSIIQAELKVDETDIVNISLGDKAEIKVDALPDQVLEGDVAEIGNSPINASMGGQQEAKDFKVVVTLRDPDSKLRPGMSCTGDIITDVKERILAIPIQALTIREVEVDEDGNYHEPDLKKTSNTAQADSSKTKPKKEELEGVFVVTADKLARFRPVKTGITGESEIEVLDSLDEGEEVVSGTFQTLRTIKDGAAVKVDNSAKSGVGSGN
jgi:HlyD family secretion protein